MLVESAKPPLPEEAKVLALEVAGSMKDWSGLLKRPFQTLKADGPFIYESGGDRVGDRSAGVARRSAQPTASGAGAVPARGD